MSQTKTELSETKRALLAKRLQKAKSKKAETDTIPPRPPDEPVALSFAQQRLWFLDQWQPHSATYNIPLALRLSGALDPEALGNALQHIVDRHEVLRMVYATVAEEPVLLPHPDPTLRMKMVDLAACPPNECHSELQRLAQEEAARPFNLAHDLPLRTTLVSLCENEWALLLTMHHIASDGWSMGLLVEELAALYKALVAQRPSPLSPLPIQYADYAHWQRRRLQDSVLGQQLAYWQKQLDGAATVLELPTDHPRPPVQTYRGAVYRFQIAPALMTAVTKLSQQEGVTPFMTLLAAFQLLLYRYTGQEDMVVGSTVAGRNHSQIEKLIGFFVNTLVLRTDLSGNPTVVDLLQRVREVALGAYGHQDLPFEKVVEALQPERNLSHSPLFQVMLTFNNTPQKDLALPGVSVDDLPVDSGTSKFDLILGLDAGDDGLHGTITYNTDLFNEDTMARMAGHFQVLLRGITADPRQPLSRLSLLTPAEHRQLTDHWNDTRTAYPPVQAIHHLFAETAARQPQATAVVFEGQQYSYRQLNQRANQLAHFLRSQGVGPEVCVGLFMERSLDIVVAILGILKAGGAYVPLDPIYPQERIHYMLAEAQAPILLTQAPLTADLPSLPNTQTLCLDRDWDKIAGHKTTNPPPAATPQNLMYVLFTSGSTGRPKGVAVAHGNYLNYFHGVMARLDVEAGWRFAIVTTFAADLGTTMVWGALCSGGELHIISYERAADPGALAAYCRRHPVDVLKMVPSHFEAMQVLPDPADVLPRHRLVFAGEACHWSVVEKVRALRPDLVIQNHYGPTETAVAALTYQLPRDLPAARAGTVPLGRPLGNVQVYLLDDHYRPVPVGVPGELYIGGAGITRGYLHRPDLTAASFIPNPFRNDELSIMNKEEDSNGAIHHTAKGYTSSRLYKTGDLGRYRADGHIEFLQRVDQQVKVRGYRIELGEIETLLRKEGAVQDTAVIVREDTPGDKRLVAYVVPQPESSANGSAPHLDTGKLRNSLRAQLPDYMVPTAFVPLDTIPLNPNGKVDRFALPAPDPSRRDLAESFIAPRNGQETRLAAIWSQVLGVEQVGIDDNFFDLGGESFKAIRVVRQIGDEVSVMALFKYPTVRQLAAHLDQASGQEEGLLHRLTPPVAPAERLATLVCIPYGGGSAVTYQPLATALPPTYALYALEIPGHDYSRCEEALRPLPQVARQCVAEIKEKIDGPVILYGHCLGGALAIEIARLLEAENRALAGIFLGGIFPTARPPGKFFDWLAKIFPSDRRLSNRAYHEFLRALGGFTDIIDPEEQEFVMRSLRHDAREAEDYFTREFASRENEKLQSPLLCVVGEMDRATELYEERYKEWGFFSDVVELAVIPRAGHYFLKHQAHKLAQIITQQANAWQAQTSHSTNGRNAANEYVVDRYQSKARRLAPAPQAAAPSMRLFLLVALGQLVSLVGTGLTSFALGVWVYQQTGSVSDFAFISVFVLLPGILVSPVAGAAVDHWDRRKVMILSDMAAACATLLVAILLWTGSLEIWHIYVTASIGSMANAFQRPAYMAAIAQLVPKPYLGHANGIAQLGIAMGELLAPLLGGVLVMTISLSGIVLIDFATFLFAVTVLLLIRFPNLLFRKQEEPLLQAVVKGWNYILKRHSLVVMVVYFVIVNFLFSIATVLVTPLVLSFDSPVVLGTVTAAGGVGLLAGGLVMSLWGGSKRRAEGMVGFVVLLGFSMLVMGIRPSPVFPAMGLFGLWFSVALINAHWQALIQAKVGLELQGRVFSTNQMLAWSMMPVGYVLTGPLADHVFEPLLAAGGPLANTVGQLLGTGPGRGMGLLIIIVGAISLLWGIVGYRYRPLRFMEDELPDAIPDAVIVADKDTLQAQADRQLQAVS